MTVNSCILALLVAGAPQGTQATIPDTPAGKFISAWVQALNSGKRESLLAFHRDVAKSDAPEQFAAMDLNSYVSFGPVVPRKVEVISPTELQVVVEQPDVESWAKLGVNLTGEKPRLMFADASRPAEIPAEKVSLSQLPTRINAFLDKLVKADRFSGTVILAKDGKPVYERAKGLASIAWNAPNNLDTKFNIASMGKMITAVAIGQLVDAKKLTYETKVGEVLPDYPNQDVREKVTIHHLLTHTSGLGDIFGKEYMEGSKERFRDLADYMALYKDKGLEFEPGSKGKYSNYGFVLLGAIIEKRAGMPYWDYVKKNIFEPAGMNDSGPFEMDFDTPNLAIGYTRFNGDGDPLTDRRRNNILLHSIKGTPAGGSFSTVRDLVRFGEALKSGKILSKAQFETLTTPKRGSYGYGFATRDAGGLKGVGHNGGFPGINSMFEIMDNGYTLVVLSNYDNGAELLGARTRDLLAAAVAK